MASDGWQYGIAVAGCALLAALNPVIHHHTRWWDALLAGAVAAVLVVAVRVYATNESDSHRAGPRDVALLLLGEAVGPLATLLALTLGQIGDATFIVAVSVAYALIRLTMALAVWWFRRRAAKPPVQRSQDEQASARFLARVSWGVTVVVIWGVLFFPHPFAAALFLAGGISMTLSAYYFARLS